MTSTGTTRVPGTSDPPPIYPTTRHPLFSRSEDLLAQERDAIRRKDWSTARIAAEERTALQEVRQNVAARRFA